MTHLSPRGRLQAHEAALFFRDLSLPVTTVLVSPLPRARETYEIYASLLPLPAPQEMALLTERDFGPFDGKRVKDVIAEIGVSTDPALESLAALTARGMTAMKEIHAHHPGETVAVFTHAQFTKGVLVGINPRIDFWFWLKNCSCSLIEVTDEDMRILAYDLTRENPTGDALP